MSVSVDGLTANREGAFGWTAPGEELFRFHLAQVGELGGYPCGRRLYETMLVWETMTGRFEHFDARPYHRRGPAT
jgi:hypothetical protein